MGTVYRKTFTKPIPAGADIIERPGEQQSRWRNANRKLSSAKVTTDRDRVPHIRVESGTFFANDRDSSGIVVAQPTGCHAEKPLLWSGNPRGSGPALTHGVGERLELGMTTSVWVAELPRNPGDPGYPVERPRCRTSAGKQNRLGQRLWKVGDTGLEPVTSCVSSRPSP